MKKKLLFLSMAFATFGRLGAQTPSFIEVQEFHKVKSPDTFAKNPGKRATSISGDDSYYYWENNGRFTSELNTFLGGPAFDTLNLYVYKAKQKTTSTTYWQSLMQAIPNTSDLTLNEITFVGSALNASGSTINVNVLDKDWNILETQEYAVSNNYGYQTATFANPVTYNDTLYVSFEMKTAADSFQLAYSHSLWNAYNFGTQQAPNVFNTALPFDGSAAIFAVTPNNASILGLISQGYDFLLIPNFSYDIAADFNLSDDAICLGDSVSFENQGDIGHLRNPILNYIEWDLLANGTPAAYTQFNFGNGSVKYSTAQASGVRYATGGQFDAEASIMIGLWNAPYIKTDAQQFAISVSNISLTTSVVNTSGPSENDGKASVTATGGVAPYTYSWSNSQLTTDTIVVGPGSYTATVTDASGCSANSATVTVAAGTGTAVGENTLNDFIIAPNPASTIVNIVFNANNESYIAVLDLSGKVLISETVKNVSKLNIHPIDISQLEAGVYFVSISSVNGSTTKKIVKQ